MALFLVIIGENLDVEPPEKWDVHKINDTTFLVSGDGLSQDIAKDFGIYSPEGKGQEAGLVLGLNGSRAGYHSPSIWEWFNKER